MSNNTAELNLPFATSHTGGCTVSRSVPVHDMERQSQHCVVCLIIWQGAAAITDSYSGTTDGLEIHKRYACFVFPERAPGDEGPLRVNLDPCPKFAYGGDFRLVKLQYYGEKGTELPWSEIGLSEHIGPSGLSTSTIGLAKQLIKDCDHGEGKHTECKPFNEKRTFLPTRVLDVGRSADSKVKLHISSNGETGPYVALSHCWGGSTPAKTMGDNITQYIEDIPYMPRTFSDAILTTRALGLRYLWIDSLCIIQDSPEDWATQAPQMAKVYGNAYVTISADAARDSTHGFLNHPRRKLHPAKSIFVKHEGKTNVIFVRERGALAYQLPYHDWSPQNTRNPESGYFNDLSTRLRGSAPASNLSSRGWVFQERVLAPRTLHFGGAELGWECRSIITCECCATSKRRRRGVSLLKKAVSTMSWTDVIEEYTQMDLTFMTDRLVALSGLAEVRHQSRMLATTASAPESDENQDQIENLGIADRISYEYIAGMWKEDMRKELMWRALSISRRNPIAPTWSWASVSSAISYRNSGNPGKQFEIIDVSYEPSSGGIYGNCSIGSYILVRGLVVPLRRSIDTVMPKDCFSTLSYRLHVSEDVPHTDEPLEIPGLSFTQDDVYILFTSSPPDPPKGLILIGAREDVNKEDNFIRGYQRRGVANAKHLAEYAKWSDEDTSEEEILTSRENYNWSWDIWEQYGGVKTIRLY